MNVQRYFIGKVGISRVNVENAVRLLDSYARKGHKAYVCVTNVHMAYIGNRDQHLCGILNESTLTVPDGMPVVWLAKLHGIKDMEKTSGPDLFRAVCSVSMDRSYTHYFYGSSPAVLSKMIQNLERKYPGIRILGYDSPPFAPIEEYDIEGLIHRMNTLRPTFLWIGLSAPKQEKLIHIIYDKLDIGICIGVGLAFDYVAGTVKRAPLWMQKAGVEWVVRVAQRPENIRRFFRPYSWFLCKLAIGLLGYSVHRGRQN